MLDYIVDDNLDSFRSNCELHSYDEFGRTPLYLAVLHGARKISGYIRNTIRPETGMSLHDAALYNFHKELENMLVEGVSVDTENATGASPLHYASLSGAMDVVMVLVNRGADVNFMDNKGRRPLHMTPIGDTVHVAEFLLANGAIVDAVDKKGHTALHVACRNNSVRTVRMLIGCGAGVNTGANYRPIHKCAEGNSVESCRVLVLHGVDTSRTTIRGQTVACVARRFGSENMLEFLDTLQSICPHT